MLTALIDYDSGNLHSAAKAFERMAAEADAGAGDFSDADSFFNLPDGTHDDDSDEDDDSDDPRRG